jgi:hypothetical protein
MNKFFSMLLVLISFVITACVTTTTELDSKGSRVRLGQSDPKLKCKELGEVDTDVDEAPFSLTEASPIGAKNKLRNLAAAKGANYIRLESISPLTRRVGTHGGGGTYGYRATGTAFLCP